MTKSELEDTRSSTRRSWKPGVRGRLLLAVFAVATFAVFAAAAGIYAFRQVGSRLDIVETRLQPTLSALELSRSAERIIATAPSLLAATDRSQRGRAKDRLAAEAERLNAELSVMKDAGTDPSLLLEIEPIVAALTASLVALDGLVERRLEANQKIAELRRSAFQATDETQRLLAPWLEVTSNEVAALLSARQTEPSGFDASPQRLASLIALQQTTRAVQAQVSALTDMLAEASTTDQSQRLPILAFQLGLGFDELQATAVGLAPKLRPLLLEQVAILRTFADGPGAIIEIRKGELALVSEGEALLAATGALSGELTAAVDRLGNTAKQDISQAIGAAVSVQRLSTRTLIAVVALSLLTSALIVWLYVGRNIVRRLAALSDSTLAIADGDLQTTVSVNGSDEIASIGRAVESFRRNTLERDTLLAEKAHAADRLEKEVEERTAEVQETNRQLEIANRYKSHFLSSASHDLRQPLHALNLFVAQLQAETDPAERDRLVQRINAAVSAMNELFEALLDMSKLDAGVLEPNVTALPIATLLARIETTFAAVAREKGLRLHLVTSSAWVRSDFVLLERILMNLVSNAVRYTRTGGVVIGCRRRGDRLRIDICDSGPGIAKAQQRTIFDEFVQLASRDDNRGGQGLGLSIVDRLSRLLDHPIDVDSRVGRGSRFSITVPLAAAEKMAAGISGTLAAIADPLPGKLVVVIDDDALVRDGMSGILRRWGCDVVAAPSGEAALARLGPERRKPDLIISDYRLSDGGTGIDAIEHMRGGHHAAIPAFLISGDTSPERLREANARGYHLLHKPVAPVRLRAMLNQLMKTRDTAVETSDAADKPPIRRRADPAPPPR